MFQDEHEIRASLRLAVADVPPPPHVYPLEPAARSSWWPALASAAAVVTVVVASVAVVRTGGGPTPVADPPVVQDVPFADRPPAERVVTMTSLQDAPPGLRACAAADLEPVRVDNRPENHRRRVVLHLRNVSRTPCAVSGFPDFDLLDSTGTPVEFPVDRVATEPERRLGVPAGQVVNIDAEWQPWCRPDPGPLQLRLRLPGGQVVTGADYRVAACRLKPNVGAEGTPGAGQLTLRQWAGSKGHQTAMSPLVARLELPASVRRGGPLRFAVVLTNPTGKAVPIRSVITDAQVVGVDGPAPKQAVPFDLGCPVYVTHLDVEPDPTTGRTAPGLSRPVHDPIPWALADAVHEMNCDVAKEVPAHSAIRMEMRLDIPAEMPTGTGWLTWNAGFYGAVASDGGLRTHDIWGQLTVTG